MIFDRAFNFFMREIAQKSENVKDDDDDDDDKKIKKKRSCIMHQN